MFDARGTMLRVNTVHELALARYTVLGWEVSDIVAVAKDLEKRRGQARTVWRQGAGFARYLDGALQGESGVVQRPRRQCLEPHAILKRRRAYPRRP